MFLANQRVGASLWNETYPKGEVIRLPNDFDIYSVGNSTHNLSMIVIYDIFGFNTSQTRVFCDRLASEYSVHVVMPDFFRGTVAPTGTNRSEWLARVGNWSKVSNELITVADWIHTSSPTDQIGLIGFCWGGLQVVRACSNLSTIFITGVSIHGSQITVNEVKQLKQPMLFMAASNDPPLHPNISGTIEQSNRNISKQCEYKTYPKVNHGFAAAGANYSNPDNVEAIDDVHVTLRNYFNKITNNISVSLSINIYFLLLLFIFSFHLYL